MGGLKAWLGVGLSGSVLLAALAAPWVAGHDPLRTDLAAALRPPGSPGHLLGTDQLGRDLLARVVHGARLALFLGACTALLTAVAGSLPGLVAGFVQRWPGAVIMRLADVQVSFPFILLALTINAIVGVGLTTIVVSLTSAGWVVYARVVRGEVLAVKAREFVQAAAALGTGRARLLFRHVLPNVAPSIVVVASLQFSQFIVAEAAISFLGFGVPSRPRRRRPRPRPVRTRRRSGLRPHQGGRGRARRRAAHDAGGDDRGLDHQQHARAHLRPPARPRPQDLPAPAHAGHRLADAQRHHLGVHPPPGRALPQRRALHRPLGEGHDRYALDPASKSHYAASAYWKPVKEVQVVDDSTVRFITEKPWPNLIDHASLTNALIMPAKALRELGPQKLAQHPIGTGPFRFVEWRRDERLVLERNPDYRQGPADVSRVTFRFIPEFSARLAALLSGEIDIMKDVPPHAVEAVERSGRAVVRSTVSSRINYLALVTLKPGPMQDVRVRRAMNHAVNVDELIAQVLKGRATRMCGPLAPPNADYAPVECYAHDPQRAVALLREAGHDPARLTLTLDTPSGRYPLDKDVSLAIAAQLQRLGIKVNVVVNEWGTHLDKIKNRTTGDMFFLGWGPALWGRGTIEPLFKADQTYASYGNNQVLDEKIARAVTLVDPRARAAAYAELQRLIRDEAPWVFLWQQHDLYGVARHVEWTPRADEKVWMYEARVSAR